MTGFEEFVQIIRRLRAPDGCPWDREQTHGSLKAACIEEASEVICGINILESTGNADNLQEELGDLLLLVVMHAQIAEEEGLFTLDDVIQGVRDKMIRRHPHVFGEDVVADSGEVLTKWADIKKQEKAGKEWAEAYLPAAFDEAKVMVEAAKVRKGFRKYQFYGWKQAGVPALHKMYKGIETPWDLYDALSDIWCADTCAPRLRQGWTPENKTLGQCSITAFLAQDIFGGKVYGVLRPGGNYHCYNVIGDCVFDLTSEQFGGEILSYEDNPEQLREEHFAKEEKRLRYEYLKARLQALR